MFFFERFKYLNRKISHYLSKTHILFQINFYIFTLSFCYYFITMEYKLLLSIQYHHDKKPELLGFYYMGYWNNQIHPAQRIEYLMTLTTSLTFREVNILLIRFFYQWLLWKGKELNYQLYLPLDKDNHVLMNISKVDFLKLVQK